MAAVVQVGAAGMEEPLWGHAVGWCGEGGPGIQQLWGVALVESRCWHLGSLVPVTKMGLQEERVQVGRLCVGEARGEDELSLRVWRPP